MTCLIVAYLTHLTNSQQPGNRPAPPTVRPITKAESVLAVYRENWGLFSSELLAIIMVVWPDGHMVWSDDRLKGGAPYRAGQVDAKKVASLLKTWRPTACSQTKS